MADSKMIFAFRKAASTTVEVWKIKFNISLPEMAEYALVASIAEIMMTIIEETADGDSKETYN